MSSPRPFRTKRKNKVSSGCKDRRPTAENERGAVVVEVLVGAVASHSSSSCESEVWGSWDLMRFLHGRCQGGPVLATVVSTTVLARGVHCIDDRGVSEMAGSCWGAAAAGPVLQDICRMTQPGP
jgi:hypothetical protein